MITSAPPSHEVVEWSHVVNMAAALTNPVLSFLLH